MQHDADGDILRYNLSVPNPAVQVQTSAVSLFGWVPGSAVLVSSMPRPTPTTSPTP